MIIDSGKGINKKEMDHIFDRYYRVIKNINDMFMVQV